VVSNWRSDHTLSDYLEQNAIPGIQGIDTRALTKKLRVRGALKGFISTEPVSDDEAVARARDWQGLVGVDYVKDVTHKEPFQWDLQDQQSASFSLVRGTATADARNVRDPMPPADLPIVAYDFGMKYNILRRLRRQGRRPSSVYRNAARALRASRVLFSDQGDCVASRQFCNGLDSALAASVFDDCWGCDRFAGRFFAR
jgi:carbamoyl-phosphate synthase small subunit